MSQTDQQVIQLVTTALETALALAQEEAGWKVEKEQDGATVKSKKNGDGRKVWLCTAMVDLPVQKLWAKLQDTDNLTSWNTTLTQSRTLKTLPGGVKVTYQVSLLSHDFYCREKSRLIYSYTDRRQTNFSILPYI